MRLINTNIRDIGVFDIETAGQYHNFKDAPEKFQKLFLKTFPQNGDAILDDIESHYRKNVCFPSAFCQIVCISISFRGDIYSFTDKASESHLLVAFDNFLREKNVRNIGGHYIKNFDIKTVAQRAMACGVKIPVHFDNYGLKPWEMGNVFDSHEIFTQGIFGSHKGSSLDACCHMFNIPSPKENLDGSKVHDTYWNGGLDEVVKYCERDVHSNTLLLEKLINA